VAEPRDATSSWSYEGRLAVGASCKAHWCDPQLPVCAPGQRLSWGARCGSHWRSADRQDVRQLLQDEEARCAGDEAAHDVHQDLRRGGGAHLRAAAYLSMRGSKHATRGRARAKMTQRGGSEAL